MIKDFEAVKKQIGELAGVINSFKSEAVQLRIIELVFGVSSEDEDQAEDTAKRKPRSSKRSVQKKKPSAKGQTSSKSPERARSAARGAVATLSHLADADFFSKPKTISDIIEHCSTHRARKFKANEFSGKLARMVRNGVLRRKKNADKQYEYTKA
ncbi:MAG: hypothetical protein GWP14_09695 [Actinobacteria bacterium]|nr:hypothetical protein [Actinomycetota bacterium]